MGCSRRWRHERVERGTGSGHHPPAMQGVADADHRGPMYATSRTGGARTADPSRLSRSTAAGRTRGTRATADRTAHPRSPSAADADARGVRVRAQSQGLAQQIHELAKGDYIAKAEPIIFIGDSGTGKTHLLTGL